MAGMSKSSGSKEASTPRSKSSERAQFDFEMEFFTNILEHYPDYVDVLRVYGSLLTRKGMVHEGLDVDRRLIRLRPRDPVAHYNIACSFSLLRKNEQAITSLRKAIELGYRDFAYLRRDRDLDGIRNDPRYKQLMREFEVR